MYYSPQDGPTAKNDPARASTGPRLRRPVLQVKLEEGELWKGVSIWAPLLYFTLCNVSKKHVLPLVLKKRRNTPHGDDIGEASAYDSLQAISSPLPICVKPTSGNRVSSVRRGFQLFCK